MSIDSLIALFLFVLFMGAPFLRFFHNLLDYGRNTILATAWFLLGFFSIVMLTNISQIFTVADAHVSISIFFVTMIIIFHFSFWWQKSGRPYMPSTPYSDETITFYDFTPLYTIAKSFEIFFQGLCAAVIIYDLYLFTHSVPVAGLLFGLLFLVIHLPSVPFLGHQWLGFVLAATVIAATVPPVLLLLVPGGLLQLFSFHIGMYAVFLLLLRRIRLQAIKSETY